MDEVFTLSYMSIKQVDADMRSVSKRLTCGCDAFARREPGGGDHGGQREGEAGGESEQDGADVTQPAGDISVVSPVYSNFIALCQYVLMIMGSAY